jgi:hypothetical protein
MVELDTKMVEWRYNMVECGPQKVASGVVKVQNDLPSLSGWSF